MDVDDIVEAVAKYSADGMRFALAMAGDSLEDANYSDEVANMAVLRLHSMLEWIKGIVDGKEQLRTGSADTFWDRMFISAINKSIAQTDNHYKLMNIRDAMLTGFFDLQEMLSRYTRGTKSIGMHKELVRSSATDVQGLTSSTDYAIY